MLLECNTISNDLFQRLYSEETKDVYEFNAFILVTMTGHYRYNNFYVRQKQSPNLNWLIHAND